MVAVIVAPIIVNYHNDFTPLGKIGWVVVIVLLAIFKYADFLLGSVNSVTGLTRLMRFRRIYPAPATMKSHLLEQNQPEQLLGLHLNIL